MTKPKNGKKKPNKMRKTYFVPKLRHFRCPGINLLPVVTAWRRRDPLEAFAGDRFSDAIAAASAITDSFELQLEELGAGDGGSNFRESLKRKIEQTTKKNQKSSKSCRLLKYQTPKNLPSYAQD